MAKGKAIKAAFSAAKKALSKKGLGTLKPKANAFKGVESAGATKVKSLGNLKPKANAFKGVQSAGATRAKVPPMTRGDKNLLAVSTGLAAGAAAGMQAVDRMPSKKNTASSSNIKSVKTQKLTAAESKNFLGGKTRSVNTQKLSPSERRDLFKVAPKVATKAKSAPRAASFTPTSKKTPLSVSAGKKKTGYVKSNSSSRTFGSSRGR
jgi:hypothetical protein